MQPRTDSEPLQRRLRLPIDIRSVLWVAVSPIEDSGGVPGPADFHTVYAYIELDPAAWSALEKSAAPLSRGTILIPQAVAAVMIPAVANMKFKTSSSGSRAEGTSFNPAALATDPKTDVESAVRVGGALVIKMRVQ